MEIKSSMGLTRPEQGSSVAKSNPTPAPAVESSGTNSFAPSAETVQVNNEAASGSSEKDRVSKEPTQEQIRKTVAEINRNAQGTEAVFGIHDATNRVTIKIINKETKEVIKELPPEKTLDMIAKAWELAGLLVDEKR